MIDTSTIQKLVQALKTHLAGVVTLTGRIVFGFVSAVFAGLGAGLILGITLALIAALGLAGIKVQPVGAGIADDPAMVIDITRPVA